MYSNILDTVRIPDAYNLIATEAFLMRSALSREPAVLSPNQAIDSIAIQLITEGNGHNSKNHFITAVKKGLIKVAIPSGYSTLLEYCLAALRRGKKDSDGEFKFSSLNFLYEKVDGKPVFYDEERREVLDYIYTELSEIRLYQRSGKMPQCLTLEQESSVYRYICAIRKLDESIRYYKSFTYRQELLPCFIKGGVEKRICESEPQTELSHFLLSVINVCDNAAWPIYRSYYYRLCEGFENEYSAECIAEFKTIVDISYNQVIALSMNDSAELNIAAEFSEIAAMHVLDEKTNFALVSEAKIHDGVYEKLDWECLVTIYEEITALCKSKGLTWEEAMELYHARQRNLPIVVGGKYLLITALTMAISSTSIVAELTRGMTVGFGWNLLCDVTSDAVSKPSVLGIISDTKKSKKRTDMMDILVTQSN